MAELRDVETKADATSAAGAASDGEALLWIGGLPDMRQRRCGRALGAGVALAAALLAGSAILLFGASRPAASGHEAQGGALGAAAASEVMVLDEESDRQVQMGVCVIDAHQAAFYLAQAGTFIRFATLDCPDAKEHEDRLACAAEVSVVINSVAWTAAYIAASVNSCGSDRNVGAACAASLAALVAELGEFAFIASSVVQACELEEDEKMHHHPVPLRHPEAERHLMDHSREELRPPSPAEAMRLLGDHAVEMKLVALKLKEQKKEVRKQWEEGIRRPVLKAQCFIDVNLGLGFLARAGFQIYYLNQACPSSDPKKRKACALDVFNVISSFAWAAQFLAQLAVDCPEVVQARAACAAVVSDFVAVVAALGPVVNGVADDCPAASLAAVNGTAAAALPVGFADFFG